MSGERTRPRHRGFYLAGVNRVFSACFQGTIEFLGDAPTENETAPVAVTKYLADRYRLRVVLD